MSKKSGKNVIWVSAGPKESKAMKSYKKSRNKKPAGLPRYTSNGVVICSFDTQKWG